MLHPQARALLDFIEKTGLPKIHTLPPTDARVFYRERRTFTQLAPAEVSMVRDLQAQGPHGAIPVRLYRPAGAAMATLLPVLVYFHGGGWVIGDLDTHDVLCRELANGAGCAVVAADYRMAPEYRFPCAVDDALAATYWVSKNASAMGLDPSRLAVGGDSAGGTLAAVVSLLARDAGDLPIVFQLLIYPATDMRCTAPSHKTNAQGYLLTADTISYFLGHYFGAADDKVDYRASPLLTDDLTRLPAAFVLTAGYDPLRDEGLQYAQRLNEAGNRATQVCFERQIHGFITMGKVLDEANSAVAICADQLRRAFAA